MNHTKTIAPTGTEAGFDLDKLFDANPLAEAFKLALGTVALRDFDEATQIANMARAALARRAAPDSAAQPDTTASASMAEKDAHIALLQNTIDHLNVELEETRAFAAQPVQAGEAVDLLQRMRAAFHVNMLRAFPDKTHAEIEAEIDKVCGIARASLAPVSAQPEHVGEIVMYPNYSTVVHWNPVMPPSGTKLYAAPVSAQQGAAEQHNAVECDSALRAQEKK